LLVIVCALASFEGCSLAHDFDGLEASTGVGGGGGSGCVPRVCADVSPACGDLDDGCGNPLACGCAAPSSCDEGVCTCPTTPLSTLPKLANVATGNSGTGADWADVLNVKHSDDAGASTSVVLGPGERSRNLQVRDFGISELPSDATIASVTLNVCRWKATSNGNLSIRDEVVQLIVGGMLVPGTNLANDISWIWHSGTCEEFPYIWQVDGDVLSLTVEDVQDPFFGAHFVVKNPLTVGGDVPGEVGWMTMSVSYFEACAPTSE
jgi:hypothetical protein